MAHAQNSIYQALILPRKEAHTARIQGPEYEANNPWHALYTFIEVSCVKYVHSSNLIVKKKKHFKVDLVEVYYQCQTDC